MGEWSLGRGVFSDLNLLRLCGSVLPDRERLSLFHASRVELLSQQSSLPPAEVTEEECPAFLCFQIMPSVGLSNTTISLRDQLDRFWEAVVTHITGIGETRWHQDGVTLQDRRGEARDAVTFFKESGIELFSRKPFFFYKEKWFTGLNVLIERVLGAVKLYEEIHDSEEAPASAHLDLSLLGVGGAPLYSKDPEGFVVSSPFDRTHVHLTHTLTRTEGLLEEDLRLFLDWVAQAGGLSRAT